MKLGSILLLHIVASKKLVCSKNINPYESSGHTLDLLFFLVGFLFTIVLSKVSN